MMNINEKIDFVLDKLGNINQKHYRETMVPLSEYEYNLWFTKISPYLMCIDCYLGYEYIDAYNFEFGTEITPELRFERVLAYPKSIWTFKQLVDEKGKESGSFNFCDCPKFNEDDDIVIVPYRKTKFSKEYLPIIKCKYLWNKGIKLYLNTEKECCYDAQRTYQTIQDHFKENS